MSEPLIRTLDLWKTYKVGSEEIHALRGVTLEIQRNEYVTIMGPSGSGKSTLMNLIGCLDTPAQGQYFLNGKLVSEMHDDELAYIRNQVRLEYYVGLLRAIRKEFPAITIHSFSPTEIDFIAKLEKKTVREIFLALKEAGLDSMPGGGGEILVKRVRDLISPRKISADRWLEVQREAHLEGFKTTATMVIGHVETVEERIIHLLKLRELQDETGGFRAFIVWTMSTAGTPTLSHLKRIRGEDYLRIVAIARILLDNITHLQSGWVTEGHKLAQTALAFGADDMGGILMEEEVVSKTGVAYFTEIEDLLHLIRSAGYQPLQRNTQYKIVREFD